MKNEFLLIHYYSDTVLLLVKPQKEIVTDDQNKVPIEKQIDDTAKYMLWAIFSGIAFLILKLSEYYPKINAGLDMNYSSFFMNYWLLTGFHWIHVLAGVVILYIIRRSILKKKNEASLEDLEAGTAFWHMCDLIWLLLFPILYLLF